MVLPGQFLSRPEPPSPYFLRDFQGVLAGRAPLATAHHTTPSPTTLLLERSLHFFKLQVVSRVETVSTHRLKPCHTPEHAQAAEPPRRGRPPAAAKTSVVSQPCLQKSSASKHLRRVSFADPLVTAGSPPPRPPPAPPDITLGRPVRSTKRPTRYLA